MIRRENVKEGIPFFIHQEIIKKLNDDSTPFKGNPALPYVGKDGLNYLETIAVKRYEDLVENFQRTVGVQNITPQHVMANAYQNVFMIDNIERPHWRKLEEMAVKYVKQDFNLLEDEILFDVEIIGLGNVKMPEDMKFEPMEEDVDPKFEYEMTDELHKRRFINALTAGASKKGHYIFHLAEEELAEINPRLTDFYQRMMIANDLTYYMLGDEFAKMAMESDMDENNAGTMEIKWDENGTPIIYARAINFPTLIHETIKGVMEIISFIAFPDGKEEQQYVINESDHVLGEMWDLRVGPSFWEIFHSSLTIDEIPQKKMILSKLYQLETSDFLEHFNKLLTSELEK